MIFVYMHFMLAVLLIRTHFLNRYPYSIIRSTPEKAACYWDDASDKDRPSQAEAADCDPSYWDKWLSECEFIAQKSGVELGLNF